MNGEKEHVALTKCYFCGGNNEILLATRYNSKGKPLHDLGPMHGKVVNTHPCPQCEKLMKQGVIIIAVSDDTTDEQMNEKPPNPYRTGQFFVVKDAAIKRWADEGILADVMAEHLLKARCGFFAESSCKALGLIKEDGSLAGPEDGGEPTERQGGEHG